LAAGVIAFFFFREIFFSLGPGLAGCASISVADLHGQRKTSYLAK